MLSSHGGHPARPFGHWPEWCRRWGFVHALGVTLAVLVMVR